MYLLAFLALGPIELCVIGVIAVLLFGNRLPKIARSVDSTIVEFKKGVKGIEDEAKDIGKELKVDIKDD